MNLICVEPPTSEPISLEDVEKHTRLQGQLTDEQSTVDIIISAICERAESLTNRALISQTWEASFNLFPSERIPIVLPKPPLQSVVSIKYFDVNNVEQTLNPLSYKVVLDNSDYGYVIPIYGLTWPVALNDVNSVTIKFVCGYGPIEPETSDNIPAGIKQWMLINAANLIENRESIVIGNGREAAIDITETLADSLIANYRLYRL
jgi:uncharacterized phiE125 gp8 family phage protein